MLCNHLPSSKLYQHCQGNHSKDYANRNSDLTKKRISYRVRWRPPFSVTTLLVVSKFCIHLADNFVSTPLCTRSILCTNSNKEKLLLSYQLVSKGTVWNIHDPLPSDSTGIFEADPLNWLYLVGGYYFGTKHIIWTAFLSREL